MNTEESKFYNTFIQEGKDLIEKIEEDVLSLEKEKNEDAIHSIFRYVHTLKGNSIMMGFKSISELSHHLESLLGKLRSKQVELSPEIIDVILKSVDRLKLILSDLENESKQDISDILSIITNNLNKEPKSNLQPEKQDEDKYLAYKNIAKESNRYLNLVTIDILKNKAGSLIDFYQFMDSLSEFILAKEILEDKLLPLEEWNNSAQLLFSILFLTTEPISVFLEKHSIQPNSITSIYEPEKVVTKQKEKPHHNPETHDANKDTHLKVSIHLIDELIRLVGQAIITRNQLVQSLTLQEDSEEGIRLARLSQIITNLHEKVMNTRLQKLQSIFPKIARVTRDTSKALGKKVEIFFEGGEVELDKTMIEVISESLIHIIRNSIDHGMEPENERILLGKDPHGNIKLSSSLKAGNVIIMISDDGKGLNHSKIIETAVQKGLISKEKASLLSTEEIQNLIFLPGLSTSSSVNEISGRGVGMDAIYNSFKKIGGTIKVESAENKGMSIIATVPQTVTISPSLLITINHRKYAILQKYISELIKYNPQYLSTINENKVYQLRGKMIPLIHLEQLLYPNREKLSKPEYIAIVQTDGLSFGLLFDSMAGIEEIVIKPLDELFHDVSLFAGATILGDGQAVLILDLNGIAEKARLSMEAKNITEKERKIVFNGDIEHYLIFEIGEQWFSALSSHIVRIEKINYQNIKRIYGQEVIEYKKNIIPLLKMEELFGVSVTETKDSVYAIILRIDEREIGVLIYDIVDVISDVEMIESKNIYHKSVLSHFMLDDKIVIVLDIKQIAVELLEESGFYNVTSR